MALKLRQQPKLAQKLVMTQQLRQAIELLQLNRLELSVALRVEIEQNPVLEEDFSQPEITENLSSLSSSHENTAFSAEISGTDEVQISNALADINWEDYTNNFDSNFSFSHETSSANTPSQFEFISEELGLHSYLQWQLAHSELEESERQIALYIIGNLNKYGFLELELDQIVAATACNKDEAEYILKVVQALDPPGIGARDVSESLYLQLERLGKKDTLAAEIVLHHFPLLKTRSYKALARVTGKKRVKIEATVNYIVQELTPFPGLPYRTEQTIYIVPDVYIKKINTGYIIHLNDDDLPRLKLSNVYLYLLKADKDLTKESRQYINDKLKNAGWFIKSLDQRQRTIYKVMESILRFQHDFFDRGPQHLKPLVLKDVAEDIDMHESTVSRVTSNKYVHTPQGIYELKYFFSTAIQRQGEDDIAAESIKTIIGKMIQKEDKNAPLSDNTISKRLAKDNIKIARRTVAKYREQLRILPIKYRHHSN